MTESWQVCYDYERFVIVMITTTLFGRHQFHWDRKYRVSTRSSSCCITLSILHHEWFVTMLVTFVQIGHPAGRRRRRSSRRRRTERCWVSTRLNIIFMKLVVLLYEYIMNGS